MKKLGANRPARMLEKLGRYSRVSVKINNSENRLLASSLDISTP